MESHFPLFPTTHSYKFSVFGDTLVTGKFKRDRKTGFKLLESRGNKVVVWLDTVYRQVHIYKKKRKYLLNKHWNI